MGRNKKKNQQNKDVNGGAATVAEKEEKKESEIIETGENEQTDSGLRQNEEE